MRRAKRNEIFFFSFSLFLILLFFPTSVSANTYLVENNTWSLSITKSRFTSIALGDLDNNGYFDLAHIGCVGGTPCSSYTAKIYTNNGSSFEDNLTWSGNLTAVHYGSVAWGDVDNDGDLDLALSGCNSGGSSTSACLAVYSQIYINNGTSLIENLTWKGDIADVWKSSLAFGDVDSDGDLDLALSGSPTTAKIYINNGTGFEENSTWQQDLTGVYGSSTTLVDIDNDNDLDLTLVGDSGSGYIARVYINNESSFERNTTWDQNLLGVELASVAWGDIDSNGRMDLTLMGHTSSDEHEVYNNTGTTFTSVQSSSPIGDLIGIFEGTQIFGDYDHDGDLDLFTSGEERYSTLYLYDGSPFTSALNDPETEIFNTAYGPSAVWGDLDNDSDLDLTLVGYDTDANTLNASVYINNISTANTAPNASNDFNTTYSNTELTLQWGNASDDETAALGLYYNLRVGNASGSNKIVSGVYGGGDDNGYFGNMIQRKSVTLKNIDISGNDTIFWSVQTIDTALRAGDWSVEQSYTLPADVTQPDVTLNAPVNLFNTTDPVIIFNATVYDDTNLTNVSLYGNWSGWHTNETNSSGINNTDYLFTKNLTGEGDGNYLWLIEAYDETNNTINSSIWNFRIDTTYPVVTLVAPDNASTWTSSQTVTFTYNVSDLAILNCSLIIDEVIDQNSTSITVNAAQTFTKTLANGEYSWRINCTDTVNYENGSETRNLTVSYTSPPPGGGGGSGESAGGSTTATSETRTTGTIQAGETKTVSFTGDLSITDVELTMKDKVSDTIKVQDITFSPGVDTPAISSEKGAVYKYLSITAAKVSEAMEKAAIKFKVTRNWIDANQLDENTVELKRFNVDSWESLPTEKVKADKDYFYYEAETTSFSKFAIVGQKKVEVIGEEEIPPALPPPTAENVTGEVEVEEEMLLGEKSKRYTWWVAMILLLGFGYLIYYEWRHLKR